MSKSYDFDYQAASSSKLAYHTNATQVFTPSSFSPYTYFKDREGYIYFARQIRSLEQGIEAVMVYYPDTGGSRVQQGCGLYTKMIAHGLYLESSYLYNTFSNINVQHVLSYRKLNALTREEYLCVPFDAITEVYNPHASLDYILSGEVMSLAPTAMDKIAATLALFAAHNITRRDIGLYGSLQCLMTKPDGDINDVDLLVSGIDNYKTVVTLARGNQLDPLKLTPLIASHPIRRMNALRRGALSQVKVLGFDDLVCDVRILRNGDDNNSYERLYNNYTEDAPECTLECAVVIEANESLSMPYAYEVMFHGTKFTVIGKHYYFIGVATYGDQVTVKGLRIADDCILLHDAEAHYIHQI